MRSLETRLSPLKTADIEKSILFGSFLISNTTLQEDFSNFVHISLRIPVSLNYSDG